MELDIKVNVPDKIFNRIVENTTKEYPQHSKEHIIQASKTAVRILARIAAEEAIWKGKVRL